MNGRIKVCVLDDDPIHRKAIKLVCEVNENKLLFYSEYKLGSELIQSLKSPFQPDIFIIDINLPDMSGIQCAKACKRLHPEIPVVISTAFPNQKVLQATKELNVDIIEKSNLANYMLDKYIIAKVEKNLHNSERIVILKDKSVETFVDGLSNIHNGIAYESEAENLLSPKQKTVIQLKSKGATFQKIAEIMGITLSTVQTHYERAIEKLKNKQS